MAGNWNLQRISIRARLRIFLSSVVFLMLLGSLLSLWQFRNVSSHAARVSHAEQRITSLLRLNNNLITLMSQLNRAAEDQNAGRFEREAHRLLDVFQAQSENTGRSLQEIGRESDRYGLLVGTIQSMLEGLPARVASFVQLAQQGDWIALHARLLNQVDHTDDVVAALVEEAETDLADARRRLNDDMQRAERRAANAIALTAVLSLIAAGLLGTLLTRSITRPLSDLDVGAQALAAGQFDHRVPVNGSDELSDLARVFNRTAGELARLFEEVQRERSIAEAAKADLQIQAQELARANSDLQQFAYTASHDLQEPLRTVTLYGQMLQKYCSGQFDSRAEEYLDFMIRAAKMMRQLITDLLEYTEAASMGGESKTSTDVSMVLDRVVTSLNAQIRDQTSTVTAGPLPRVKVREIHVQQLLQNLVGNAVKYRGERTPEIHVSAERQDDYWLFSVRDNGIGIQPRYAKQVFGIFKRLHGSEYPGTGIGLAICQRIVELYAGRIWVESDGIHGSTFWFTLPGE